MVHLLQTGPLAGAAPAFYNSLEAPALDKFPLLALFQEFLRGHGGAATLMSGSGSTTFAIFPEPAAAEAVVEKFQGKFGGNCWLAVVPV